MADREYVKLLHKVESELRAKVDRLTRERDEARADAERMRLAAAIEGAGVDPNGYYAGTPGSRLRHLLNVEEAAKEYASASAALERFRAGRDDLGELADRHVAARFRLRHLALAFPEEGP